MADWFLGEVRPMAITFAPVGWAPCDGRRLSIGAYPDLYALLGTRFGGDGTTTFAICLLYTSDAADEL